MAPQPEFPYPAGRSFARNAWMWPALAAIVMGGSLLFWSLAGLIWLATHPVQRTIVVVAAPHDSQTKPGDQPADPLAAVVHTALENHRDDHTD